MATQTSTLLLIFALCVQSLASACAHVHPSFGHHDSEHQPHVHLLLCHDHSHPYGHDHQHSHHHHDDHPCQSTDSPPANNSPDADLIVTGNQLAILCIQSNFDNEKTAPSLLQEPAPTQLKKAEGSKFVTPEFCDWCHRLYLQICALLL